VIPGNPKPVELKEIRTLIELMKKNGLAVFKMEREDFKITLKTAEAGGVQIATVAPAPMSVVPHAAPATATASPESPAVPTPQYREIKSPMVGTFYTAPSPDAEPFIEAGSDVGPETVVCIIEAMKVMNEIKAELSGTVVEVCAENGKPVQFGQVLFRVK
jgi:acetyl-CoA carboxylase biotin carboxyl carrier protein